MSKKIIEAMRLQRLEDLCEYMKSLDGLPGLTLEEQDRSIQERKAILNLELPFKTDATSLLEAYKKTYPPKANWSSKEHASNPGFSEEETWQRNSFFKALHKQQILPIFYQVGDETLEVPVEDFHLESVYQLIKVGILGSDLKESMKKKWCSMLISNLPLLAVEEANSLASDRIRSQWYVP